MTEMLKVTLEPRAFEVVTAHTGEEGIDAAKNLDPDVIILDLFMPGMDGWQVCKAVPSGVLVAHLNNLIRRARAERDASETKDWISYN
jgi:CheY-like chemotaxis protein